MDADQRRKAIDALVERLAEFGDAIQVHVSWLTDDQSTAVFHSGRGNWYARRAMAEEFVEIDQARTVAECEQDVREGGD